MYKEQIEYIRSITDFEPEIAIVLGSGLGGLAEKIEKIAEISYSDIPNMPISTAPNHKGQFVFGYLANKKVVLMQGRVHLYEGYSNIQMTMPIRILKLLGVKTILLTNAAGGINKDFYIGDFMVFTDHISCFIDSCLIGKNDDNFGVRFPDMSEVYSKRIINIIDNVAKENNIKIQKGVYVQLKGPQFETPAEIKMLSKLGADAVGMSTVIDSIAAKHCGLEIGAISVISNMAAGICETPLSGEDVEKTGKRISPIFEKLITQTVRNL